MAGTSPAMTFENAMTAIKSISPQSLRAMLIDGGEIAPVDVREELTFSLRHLLWARNIPLSRLEMRFGQLVPRCFRAPATATSQSSKAA